MPQFKRAISLLFALMLFFTMGLTVFAGDEPEVDAAREKLTITAETNRVHKKKTLQLTANTDKKLIWTTSDSNVAVVDENGLVTGRKVGHAHITAIEEETGASAQFKVFVIRTDMPWRNLLEKNSILGYRYSYEDDFYYTDDLNCWQKFFGYNFAYDNLAPLFLMEYDYTRVFFTYDQKDWMIQMWKGQYGAVFYGSEVGVYNKPEGAKSASMLAHFAAADETDFLMIGTKLLRKNFSSGEYEQEYETPYDTHWWATGFVPGHLRDTTPCDELRLVSRITLKDEEMASKFGEGLVECGFKEVNSEYEIVNDTFYRDGADVYLQWQNISQAANSNAIQMTFWGVVGFNGLIILLLGSLIAFMLGGGILGALILFLFI